MPERKSLQVTAIDDLAALISSGAHDARSFEFKEELPRHSDDGEQGFLQDVASFANAQGGDIVYGVQLRSNGPLKMKGLDHQIITETIPWLERVARSGIMPHIPGIRFSTIELENHKASLLVSIPKSWAGPHMVASRSSNNFYSRNASGKYLLDVEELRAAFLFGESLGDRLRTFRLDRINAIMNRELSITFSEAPKMVLHILPLAAFRPGFRIDLTSVTSMEAELFRPMEARGLVSHYNYHGLITFSSMEKCAYSYVQMFRNGCLEAAEGFMLQPRDGRRYFPSVEFEREIIMCGNRTMAVMRRLHIEPPYVAMLSFLGVRGYSMFVGSMRWQSNAHQIERDNLYIDEVIINDATDDFSKAIRPAFDQVWNSCGFARSMNYDEEGVWSDNRT